MSTRREGLVRILLRGLRMRCPRCGEGRLFESWYTLTERCGECGLSHGFVEGNTWAFMYISTAALTGVIVVAMLLIRPESLWLGQAVVFPVALVLIVGSLPQRKGLAIAIEYLIERRVRPEDPDDAPPSDERD